MTSWKLVFVEYVVGAPVSNTPLYVVDGRFVLVEYEVGYPVWSVEVV
jgi:hypothetical protein